MKYGSVVDDLPVVVTPDRVADFARLDLRDVARDESVQERLRIRPADAVFGHRRDVEHCAGIANGGVFECFVEVRIRGEIVLPPMPLAEHVELRSARMERRAVDRL